METIKYKDQIISIIYRDEDWTKGLNFITPDELFVQVGSWWYDKGKILQAHSHNEFERSAMITQESVYVKSGSMRVTVYAPKQEVLQSYDLYEGDLAVFAYGGHGYEILEDDTKIIESKNGPFISVDKDKTKF
jgi:hypothetical protein